MSLTKYIVKAAESMVMPYMMHHYVDALRRVGLTEEARRVMLEYWGGMVRQARTPSLNSTIPRTRMNRPMARPL